MKTGKYLVDLLSDLTGHEPDWRLFPHEANDACEAFSTAIFHDVRNETVAALMPLEVADSGEQHFVIEVSSAEIEITVFCRFEDAPADARKACNLKENPNTLHTESSAGKGK